MIDIQTNTNLMFSNILLFFLAWKVENYFNVYKSTMKEHLPKEASLIHFINKHYAFLFISA